MDAPLRREDVSTGLCYCGHAYTLHAEAEPFPCGVCSCQALEKGFGPTGPPEKI